MTRQSPHHDRPLLGRVGNSVRRRRSFTLIELLITVSIIAIMASMVLFATFSAQEQAKVMKTRGLIAKLNNIVRARYDSYRTRRVPADLPAPPVVGTAAYLTYVHDLAKMRLDVLRDLMRMEMPDRWTDVDDDPATPFGAATKITRPSVNLAYRAKYSAGAATPKYQGAECLYMIVMEAVAREGDTRDVFRADDVADVDGDGFSEFVDAWNHPIKFLRWPAGFQSEMQTLRSAKPKIISAPGPLVQVNFVGTGFDKSAGNYLGGTLAVLGADGEIEPDRMARITGYIHTGPDAVFTCEHSGNPEPFSGMPPSTSDTVVVMAPDPFDSRGVYPIFDGDADRARPTFGLYPLVYSAGADGEYGIVSDEPTALSYAAHKLVPIPGSATSQMMGTRAQLPEESDRAWEDNIHNHALNLR